MSLEYAQQESIEQQMNCKANADIISLLRGMEGGQIIGMSATLSDADKYKFT